MRTLQTLIAWRSAEALFPGAANYSRSATDNVQAGSRASTQDEPPRQSPGVSHVFLVCELIVKHVESHDVLEHLRRIKVDFAQGFGLSPVQPIQLGDGPAGAFSGRCFACLRRSVRTSLGWSANFWRSRDWHCSATRK
jgi:hypothetical protein